MEIDLKKGTVTLYEATCSLCKQKIRSPDKGGCRELLVKHIDNECEIAKTLKEWEKEGIYKEMMGFLREAAILKQVKKLVKKYGFEQVKQALNELEP